mgnify:CR=1 FL=1|jgi:large conductance mechanosensitive channel
MGFVSEFKEFAMKGNVVDMAVGIIIGAEFGKIVNSLVNDVIMPPIGLAIGGVNFKDLKLIIQHADAVAKTTEVSIGYGAFFQAIFNFIIIALAIFMMIKAINAMRKDTVSEKTPA